MQETPPNLLADYLSASAAAPQASQVYATHGALVAVDPETGFVELLDYAVAEDCGTMVNPPLV
jgi:CO/xanthine dehydrogenase Mo-binding subunit